MKNSNLKNALNKFNQLENLQEKNEDFVTLNPEEASYLKGGFIAIADCTCKKGHFTCNDTYRSN